ncbi:MAG: OsmC family peroxiredoxin [Euzebyales bacterium]|nr:OsmC family peroxiredoxin [Euzebyales bacterium]MBA3620951.1 OsmC family peroxiredoxin [Euzebyales bacterium]
MAADRKATTQWQGDLKSGNGATTLDTSGLGGSLAVSWPSRAEEAGRQTSPEELLAAAHATCFSMFLSKVLADNGNVPDRLETSAVASFSLDGGAHVSAMALTVRGSVPGIDKAGFVRAAEAAKEGCPLSKAIAGNVEITLDAALA